MQNTKPAGSEIIAWTPLPWVALLAAFATAVANALVYFAASGLGFISHSVLISSPTGEKPLSVGPVPCSNPSRKHKNRAENRSATVPST
jgi:hypothetical protein